MRTITTIAACLFASAIFSQANSNASPAKKPADTKILAPLPSQAAQPSPAAVKQMPSGGPVLLPTAAQITTVYDPAALKKTAVKTETQGKKD